MGVVWGWWGVVVVLGGLGGVGCVLGGGGGFCPDGN